MKVRHIDDWNKQLYNNMEWFTTRKLRVSIKKLKKMLVSLTADDPNKQKAPKKKHINLYWCKYEHEET